MFDEAPFGAWLKEYRKAQDLTRADLAERIGCTAETIHKIETGERRPSRQLAGLLATHIRLAPAERAAFIAFARGSHNEPPDAAGRPTRDAGAAATAGLDAPPERSAPRSPPTNLHAPLTRL